MTATMMFSLLSDTIALFRKQSMMDSIFSDEILCLNSQSLGLFATEVWPRYDSGGVLKPNTENSNEASSRGRDRDAIF